MTDPELPAPASSTQPVTGIDVLGAGLVAASSVKSGSKNLTSILQAPAEKVNKISKPVGLFGLDKSEYQEALFSLVDIADLAIRLNGTSGLAMGI